MKACTRILLLTLAWAGFTAGEAFAEHEVRITNGEWPPYLSRNLKHYGVGSRIVTEAFARVGITVEYGFFPWARALHEARVGSWDGSAIWTYSQERGEQFYYSEPVIESGYVFFHLKSRAFEWRDLDDLSELKIGGTLEYNYGDAFNAAVHAGTLAVEWVPSDEQNLRMLLAGRIDVFPIVPDVAYAMLGEHFTPEEAERLTYNPNPLWENALFLLLSRAVPTNEQRIVLFNEGLRQLNEEGLIDQYIQESRQGEYVDQE